MNFCALDVETANSYRGSICQVGLVRVEEGKVVDQWETFVDPEVDFDPINISLHNIRPKDVVGAPKFPQMLEMLRPRVRSLPIVSHSPFDRTAFLRCYEDHSTPPLDSFWLDSVRIARCFLPGIAGGYRLKNLCQVLDINLNHHDALSDAKACVEVVLRSALAGNVESFHEIVKRVSSPRSTRPSGDADVVHFESDVDINSLEGETVLFTGTLSKLRSELAQIATALGATVASSATKKVTLLVVGTQHKQLIKGFNKSSKHRKVDDLIKEGYDIKIVDEQSFLETIS